MKIILRQMSRIGFFHFFKTKAFNFVNFDQKSAKK